MFLLARRSKSLHRRMPCYARPCHATPGLSIYSSFPHFPVCRHLRPAGLLACSPLAPPPPARQNGSNTHTPSSPPPPAPRRVGADAFGARHPDRGFLCVTFERVDSGGGKSLSPMCCLHDRQAGCHWSEAPPAPIGRSCCHHSGRRMVRGGKGALWGR